MAGVLSILVSAGLALGIYEGQYSLLCVALIGTGICNGAQNPAMVRRLNIRSGLQNAIRREDNGVSIS